MTLDLICAEEAAKAETARLSAQKQERAAGEGQLGQLEREGPSGSTLGQEREGPSGRTLFSMPPGEDLAANPKMALRAALWGLEVCAGCTGLVSWQGVRGAHQLLYQTQTVMASLPDH